MVMGRGSTGAEEGFFRGSERVRGLPTPGCGRGLVSSQERRLFFYTDYYIVYFYFICKHFIYLFLREMVREGERGRERTTWETSIGCMRPNSGPGPWPRRVP